MTEANINEKMRIYSALAEKTIVSQKIKCRELQDEVELCRSLIQSLQFNLSEAQERINRQENVNRVSQFHLEWLESGGTREVKLKEQASTGLECTVISECDGRVGCYQGYPGGRRKCRELGIQYDTDGIQVCHHYEACTVEFLQWQSERCEELARLVPEFPLTSLPAWEDVAQLRCECLKRCVGRWAGWRAKLEKKGKGQMTGEDLSDWIQKYTQDDATLSNSPDTGVMYCPIKVVVASLATRKIKSNARALGNGQQLRLQLRAILQLEQEYTRDENAHEGCAFQC